MTKPDGLEPGTNEDVSPAWGTWEELLLAFAVNRHGTAAWDSIATELQKRTSDPKLCLTAHNCRLKYLDLKRRFVLKNGDLEEEEDKSNVEESVPLLEELRKLRVAELRREVQRYDLNIESLELKMKRMEEERERSLGRENSEADLENKVDEKRDCEPDAAAAAREDPAAGGELEKDQLSVNESNSTDPGAEKLRTGKEDSEPAGAGGEEARKDPIGQTSEEPVDLKSEPDHKSVPEDSCNGSSNSIEETDRKSKSELVSCSAELAESDAESDGGGAEARKENSDVQSSASRSRKQEGSDKVHCGSTSGDEREHEDQSRAVKELSAGSQPLFDLLQAIRAPKLGSIFDRRLRSQETSKYEKLILQHMDLETVERRVKEGLYSGSAAPKFFRDLLLLVNNALVFFGKNSAEAKAAAEIRRLISSKHAKSESISLQSMSKKEEAEGEAEGEAEAGSLMLKPRISGSLIVCRKRSSIAAKASSDKKKEQKTSAEADDKDTKQQRSQLSGDAEEEPKITKKRTRDRFPAAAAAAANSKKNGKNQGNKQTSESAAGKQQQAKGGSSSQQQAEGSKKSQSTSDSKKRGAANFLNRMKQGSSSSNNGLLLDALKNTPLTSESTTGKGGSEQKKNENPKRGEKKEARRITEPRQTKEKEKSSPGKRNVGRPPKRAAAPPPPAPSKRGRDRVEPEPPAASKQPRKRSRKL